MSIEAMKQALEALERAVSTCFDRRTHEDVMSRPEHFINQTITALRTAIEAAEKQEPVAWLYRDAWGTLKLSQIMPPPVGAFPVYTTPPAAQRQPLTEEEIELLSIKHAPPIHPDFTEDDDFIEFARAIEAAHGITAAKGQA